MNDVELSFAGSVACLCNTLELLTCQCTPLFSGGMKGCGVLPDGITRPASERLPSERISDFCPTEMTGELVESSASVLKALP